MKYYRLTRPETNTIYQIVGVAPTSKLCPRSRIKIMLQQHISHELIRLQQNFQLVTCSIFIILLHLFFCFSSLIGIIYVKKIDVIFAMNPSFFVALPALIYKILFHKKIIRNVDDLWPEVFYDLKIIKSNFLKKILDFFSQFS